MSSSQDSPLAVAKRRFEKTYTRELPGHRKRVLCVGWNCTGDKLASGSYDHSLRLFAGVDRRVVKDSVELTGHTSPVQVLCWSPVEADLLASTAEDKTARIWDARAGKQSAQFSLRGEGLNLAWSNDGANLVVGCKAGPGDHGDHMTIIDVRAGKAAKIVKFHYHINEMSFGQDDKRFFLCSGTGEIEVRSWPEFKIIRSLPAHPGAVFCLAMNPKGNNFAVGSADSLISLWDMNELFCLRTYSHCNSHVRSMSISHDGNLLASGAEDSVIDISLLETGENVATIRTDGPCNEIAWHPKRQLLAYCYDDQKKEGSTLKVFGFDTK